MMETLGNSSVLEENSLEFGFEPVRSGVYASLASIPGTQLLFAGPVVCTRHDILTSMVMIKDRVAHLCLDETDVVTGGYMELIYEAVAELANKAGARAVVLITCCQNLLIGTDYDMLCKNIRRKTGIPAAHVEINRLHMYSSYRGNSRIVSATVGDIISQLLRTEFDDIIPEKDGGVNILAPYEPIAPVNELTVLLDSAGVKVRHISSIGDWNSFISMTRSDINIAVGDEFETASFELSERFDTGRLTLRQSVDINEIADFYVKLEEMFGFKLGYEEYKNNSEAKIKSAFEIIGDMPVAVDSKRVKQPFSAAKALIRYGFNVRLIRTGSFMTDEKAERLWIEENAPKTDIISTPPDLVAGRGNMEQDRFSGLLKSKHLPLQAQYFGFAYIDRMFNSLLSAFENYDNTLSSRKSVGTQ